MNDERFLGVFHHIKKGFAYQFHFTEIFSEIVFVIEFTARIQPYQGAIGELDPGFGSVFSVYFTFGLAELLGLFSFFGLPVVPKPGRGGEKEQQSGGYRPSSEGAALS